MSLNQIKASSVAINQWQGGNFLSYQGIHQFLLDILSRKECHFTLRAEFYAPVASNQFNLT